MVSLDSIATTIAADPGVEYRCDRTLHLYKLPTGEGLVTQVAVGRQMRIVEIARDRQALRVCLCEDDYPGWLVGPAVDHLTLALTPYQAPSLTTAMIQSRIPDVIEFAKAAMATPNQYLWGGTVAPNYDCSGLVQAAFAAAGIRLPRDSYQQEAFVQPIASQDLQPGDLIFFGTPDRTTHVALHLDAGRYIHSSGKDQGRNGIGIDSLWDRSDPVSQRYYEQLRICGRVTRSYHPQGNAMGSR
jgi:hypothetical protein